jgi:hypothetical protein
MVAFIETPEMQRLEKEDFNTFETKLYGLYNSKLPMKVISLMTEADRYDNLNDIIDMFDTLNEVRNGNKNIHEEYQVFNEKLNKKYLYEPYGGKEGFEKAFLPNPDEKTKEKKKKKKRKNKITTMTQPDSALSNEKKPNEINIVINEN